MSLSSSEDKVPKAVKRVHEIFKQPTFMERIQGGDITQGNLSDCWLMTGLVALANIPAAVKRICVSYNTTVGVYGLVFYRDGEWIYSIIDDKLYLKSPCWDSPSTQRDLLEQKKKNLGKSRWRSLESEPAVPDGQRSGVEEVGLEGRSRFIQTGGAVEVESNDKSPGSVVLNEGLETSSNSDKVSAEDFA